MSRKDYIEYIKSMIDYVYDMKVLRIIFALVAKYHKL